MLPSSKYRFKITVNYTEKPIVVPPKEIEKKKEVEGIFPEGVPKKYENMSLP